MPLILGCVDCCKFGLHVFTFGQFANRVVVHEDLNSLLVDANSSNDFLGLDAEFCGGCADKLGEVSLGKVDCPVVVVLRGLAVHTRLQIETSN